MRSMPSQRFCRRMFSFAACWLLSWFTMGTPIQGTLSSCSITYNGTLPPIVGSFTTGPRTFSTSDTTSREIGISIGVRALL